MGRCVPSDMVRIDNERADVLRLKPAAGRPDTFTIPGVAVIECRERGVIHIPQLFVLEKTVFAILGKAPIEPDKMLYILGHRVKIPVDHFPVRPIVQDLLRVLIIEQRVVVDVRQSHIVHIYVFSILSLGINFCSFIFINNVWWLTDLFRGGLVAC